VTQELFEIDRRRITCAGGTASIDLMLDLIAQAHGPELAIQVSEQFVLGASARARTTSACRSPRATASTTRSWCR
jgi:transcriptional regulator GlxA family with amidase domain